MQPFSPLFHLLFLATIGYAVQDYRIGPDTHRCLGRAMTQKRTKKVQAAKPYCKWWIKNMGIDLVYGATVWFTKASISSDSLYSPKLTSG